jgi:hypothetical protein
MAEGKGIDRKTVERVVAMRKKGMAWSEVLTKLDRPRSFVLAVRPLMKAVDPSSVAPSYDREAMKSKTQQTKRGRKTAGNSKVASS